ncbi:hypothetical protein F5B20DRAFT_595521 [Whalleya microplaca]|nr:hypothetical protein F5B20DRAFT_595521 [Whalleya microplaca]
MSIRIKIYSHLKPGGRHLQNDGERFKVDEKFWIPCYEFSEYLDTHWLRGDRKEHVLHVTTAHPLITENRLDWIRRSPGIRFNDAKSSACAPETGQDTLTELVEPIEEQEGRENETNQRKEATDIGIGSQVTQDREAVFKDLDILFEAFWDYYGKGTKSLNRQLDDLADRERRMHAEKGPMGKDKSEVSSEIARIKKDKAVLAKWKKAVIKRCEEVDHSLKKKNDIRAKGGELYDSDYRQINFGHDIVK